MVTQRTSIWLSARFLSLSYPRLSGIWVWIRHPFTRQSMTSPGCQMLFSFFRITMGLVEDIRIGQKCTETGIGAKVDRPAAVFDPREISRVRVTKDAAAESDEARLSLLRRRV